MSCVEIAFAAEVVQHHGRQQQRGVGDAVDRSRPAGRSATGAGRSWKNATSSADDSPTSSQPANSVSIVPASDVTTIPSTNIAYSTKKRLKPGSRCMYLARKRPDRPRQDEREDRERHRQPVEDELHEKW